ncbi:hypothetical protein EPO34_03355 [Patescibacteria group bacterium]|nr:MAG: hypothetical protein EPO34_03355 [Patescibacteria group bacterium]
MDLSLAAACLVSVLVMSAPAAFAREDAHEAERAEALALQVAAMQNATRPFGTLPDSPKPAWKRRMVVPVSAYNSDPWQTDDTPFVTASGTHVRDGIVAANFLPIGTKVKIPQLFGDKEFIVEDRMNARYGQAMDVWMESRDEARKLGRRRAMIEVY